MKQLRLRHQVRKNNLQGRSVAPGALTDDEMPHSLLAGGKLAARWKSTRWPADEVDQSLELGRHLHATWVIQKKSRERGAEAIQNSDQAFVGQLLTYGAFDHVRQAEPGRRRICHQRAVVEQQPAIHGHREIFMVFAEFPAIHHAARALSVVDAIVTL